MSARGHTLHPKHATLPHECTGKFQALRPCSSDSNRLAGLDQSLAIPASYALLLVRFFGMLYFGTYVKNWNDTEKISMASAQNNVHMETTWQKRTAPHTASTHLGQFSAQALPQLGLHNGTSTLAETVY
eukprot:910335-Pelagomonas_calceolata.AAC.4